MGFRARTAFATAVLVTASAALARADRTELDLAVPRGLDEVRGQARTTFRNPTGQPLEEVWLWLPANLLAEPPEGLDQRNARWIYPRAFEPGGIELENLFVDGEEVALAELELPDLGRPRLGPGQRVLARLRLRRPVAPGGQAVVEAAFRTVVPARFGRFGHARGTLVLAGGFYPELAAIGPGGWDLSGPMGERTYSVRLRLPPGHHAVVAGRHVVAGADGRVVASARAPYLSLVVARRLERSRSRVSGVTVELLSPRSRYRPPRPRAGPPREGLGEGVPDATRWDHQGRVLEAAAGALEVLAGLGLAPPEGTVIRLVEVPARLEMVSPVPGGALVSDRIYRVTPLEPFFRFHDLEVARAVASAALADSVRKERLADRGWVLDLLAAAAADQVARARAGGPGGGLRSMLRFGAFIPEIDMLMYSPLIEFRHLFLRPFRDEDPVREEPWRLANAWPRGAVLHDRLEDLLGPEAVRTLLGTYAARPEPLRAIVAELAGEPMEWFFDQWLGPYPSVAYRLASVRSERRDGGFVHRIVVERRGEPIREPVTVRATDRDGGRHELVWDGRGRRGELELVTASALSSVEVDPAHRLIEDVALAPDHPRLDNVRPARLRPPVFNGLMFYVSAAEAALYALVDFGLRRQYDARHGLRLRAEYEPRGLRGDLFYQAGLGPLLDLNRTRWVLTTGLTALRTLGRFGEAETEATAFGGRLGLSYDTRWYPYDPMDGWGFSLTVSGAGSVTDEGRWAWTAGVNGRAAGHLTPRLGHTLTGFVGGGLVLGEPLRQQLQSISDRFMLRAFEADETLGRARLYAGLEYRFAALTDLEVSLAQLAWLRTVFLAAFVAGGTVSRAEDLTGMFEPARLFSEVGAGVRALVEIAGVVPYVVALDVAYPLSPRDRRACSADGLCRDRAPVGVYISIQHTM